MRGRASLFLLVLLSAAFLFGIVRLFELRFEAGDVYPQYSSLRADPLGVKALYDALAIVGRTDVRRCFHIRVFAESDAPSSVLCLGMRPSDLAGDHEETYNALLSMAASGSRVVLALFPAGEREREPSEPTEDRRKGDREAKTSRAKIHARTLSERLEFEMRDAGALKKPDATLADSARDLPLPKALAWHGGAAFKPVDDDWKTIYERGGKPVLLERKFGRGTIVLSSDSYLFSNEGVRRDRHPGLIAWCVGPAGAVVFDETHLDVSEDPGIATLARYYHMHGLFAGLVLLAAVFVWKNISNPIQPHAAAMPDSVQGMDSTSAFVNLLRRNVPSGRLLDVCLDEWKHTGKETVEKIIETRALVAQSRGDVVKTYRRLCAALDKNLRPTRKTKDAQ